MKVVLAKNSGFCVGVKNAVDTVMEIAGKGVYVLGEIIHNESVLNKIYSKGVKTIESVDEIVNGILVIRSHGASKRIYDLLATKKDVKVVDCTCPFVKKTQKIVNEHFNNGYLIVIIGKAEHPEVVGLNGWCDNTAVILDGEDLPKSVIEADRVCVVAQTTYSLEKFDKILKKIQLNCVKTVAVFKTICYTTMERQAEALNLAKKSDAMVVIGGTNSSNTQKLYDICKNNCEATFYVSEPNGLDYKLLNRYKSVGIVCGASTPIEQAMEVFLTMEEKEVNSMEQAVALLDEKQNLKKGQKISVVISQVNDDGLKVYFDGKTDITLPKEELACDEFDKTAYNLGDEIEVIVMATKPHLTISQKQILVLKQEEELVKKLSEDVIINVNITGSNKGGLIGKYEAFDVFVPAREIKIGFVSDLTKYVGKTLRVKPLKVEYTPRKKEIVASQKVILEAEKAQREAEKAEREEAFFNSIALNDVVTGTVARFAQFGAFVVVNGFDCLAHVSDLSWTNVKNPADVLEIGKAYDFVVLKIDKENKKVSIGYKQLQPKPWDMVPEKYAVGDVVTGKVVRIVDFGAFVEIEKGVDGLVHVSQISHEFLENPATALKVGEEVSAKILAIIPEKEKMNLSIKALIDAPQKEVKEEEKPKKDKKAKKESDDELHSWTESASSEVSIADLLNK
ncbi:MAG: bifunctional 4-hydroxy-3-methylbut-2-enyl diphosphate reductase/30S ribosomal protein S1 [Clostridia bacterium]|nr:bifunctional 4-hydroxy-3-methylbut-2-enyl diphosphate reductase/30S ribosomal protein S1 [Clostridia bacterium]